MLSPQSCPTLCDPMNCSWPGSSVPGDSPGKSTGVGCHAFLQRILPTQGSNPGLPLCRQILYHLGEPQGKPKNTGVGSLSLLQQIFLTQELSLGLLHCRRILKQLSYQIHYLFIFGSIRGHRITWDPPSFQTIFYYMRFRFTALKFNIYMPYKVRTTTSPVTESL